MRENSTRAAVAVGIVPDDTPEDVETFYVVITRVRLIGESEVGGAPGERLRLVDSSNWFLAVCCSYGDQFKDSLVSGYGERSPRPWSAAPAPGQLPGGTDLQGLRVVFYRVLNLHFEAPTFRF